MRKKSFWVICGLFILASSLPAQSIDKPMVTSSLFFWTILIGTLCLTVAAIVGILSQSKAFRNAADNIARNPASADHIRGLVIIAWALMESLVIYVLLIDLILFFVKWGNYTVK